VKLNNTNQNIAQNKMGKFASSIFREVPDDPDTFRSAVCNNAINWTRPWA